VTRRSTVEQSKAAEREVARVLGGRRLHAGEHDGPGDIDVDGGWWVTQVKHIAGTPAWLSKGMKQVCTAAGAKPGKPMPLLVIVTKPGTGKSAEMFVVIRAEDFVLWNGKGVSP
jgi:hypothetical protein